MTYELLLVPNAEADIERIIAYLSQRSPQGAVAWCERWEEAISELCHNPLQYALAPESAAHGHEVRQLLFKTHRGRIYRAIFTVVGRGIYIIHVRGPGQRPLRRNQLRRP